MNFEPDSVWERSVTWDNHYAHIRTREKELSEGTDIKRRGSVAVPGMMIDVHAAEFNHKNGRGYSFTQLSTVVDGTMYMVTFKKCYSHNYCVTLAKRFAKQLKEESSIENQQS
jgi:hypothetical protein